MLSFSATQANHLATRGAAQRQATHPLVITFRGASLTVIASGFQDTHQLTDGGFQQTVPATVRILRSALSVRPALEETFLVVETGLSYRITGVQDNPRAPEWVCTIGTVDN